MNLKWQATILIIFILTSVTITKLDSLSASNNEDTSVNEFNSTEGISFQEASLSDYTPKEENLPKRDWNILDPKINAEAILVHSIDDEIPLFYLNSREKWRLASLTKLLTAAVVIEEIGLGRNITITDQVVATEGIAGDLKSGETYISGDLLKIMILVSSNDAAAAFEEFFGGKEVFAEMLNKKAEEIGMTSSVFFDGSGLSDSNMGTATDILKLTKYILENHPDVFKWSISPEIVVQANNSSQSRTLQNINQFLTERRFIGGKTGTSPLAGENLVSIVNMNNRRVIIVILGAEDRYESLNGIINWVDKAYTF